MNQAVGKNEGPRFESSVCGKQGTDARYAVLEKLVMALGLPRAEVIEIGSWIGYSASIWRAAINRYCPGKGSVICVDPLQPCFTPEEVAAGGYVIKRMQELLESGEALSLFWHNAKFGPAAVPIRLVQQRLETARDVLPASCDLLFVDGSHRYSDVLRDICLGAPLVRDGGILCGDDLEVQAHETDGGFLAVHAMRDCFLSGPGSHRRMHPGVTLAVSEFFGGPVWSEAGIWAMRKTVDGWRAPL